MSTSSTIFEDDPLGKALVNAQSVTPEGEYKKSFKAMRDRAMEEVRRQTEICATHISQGLINTAAAKRRKMDLKDIPPQQDRFPYLPSVIKEGRKLQVQWSRQEEAIRICISHIVKYQPSILNPCHYLNKQWRKLLLQVAPIPFPSWFTPPTHQPVLPHLGDDVVIRILELLLLQDVNPAPHLISMSLCRQWRAVSQKYFQHPTMAFVTSKQVDHWLDLAPRPYPYRVTDLEVCITSRLSELIGRLPDLTTIRVVFGAECKMAVLNGLSLSPISDSFWHAIAGHERCESEFLSDDLLLIAETVLLFGQLFTFQAT